MARHGVGPLVVLASSGLLIALDLAMLGALLPQGQAEFGFGDGAAGLLGAAGTLAAVLAALPAGRISDRRHRPRLLAIAIVVWAAATGLAAAAPTLAILLVARIVLGAGNAIDNPVASSLLTELYSPARRSRVFAVHRVGAFLGAPAGLVVGGVLGDVLGWRGALVVLIPPLLLVAAVTARLPEPRGDTRRPSSEVEGVAWTAVLAEAWAVLRMQPRRGVFLAGALLSIPAGALVLWLPTALVRDQGLTAARAGMAAGAVLTIGLVVGVVGGGVLGDRHGGRTDRRLLVALAGIACGAPLFATAFAWPSATPLLVTLALAAALLLLAVPNLSAAIGDLTPASQHGMAFAVFNLLVSLGAAAGALLVGGLLDVGLSASAALATTGLPVAAAGLLLMRPRRGVRTTL